MRIYVERGGRITGADDEADVLAQVRRVNPLADEPVLDGAGEAPRVLTWSGSLGDSLFDAHPANWLATGQQALLEACRTMAPALAEQSMTACFHPHCRHVLSDAPSCRAFLDAMKGEPFEVALAPASMLEPSMLADVEDHLRRLFEMLGHRAAMVLVNDVAVGPDGTLEPVPLGRGGLPLETIERLIVDCVPDRTPIVVGAEDFEAQRGLPRWRGRWHG